jgi:hypothetical protein
MLAAFSRRAVAKHLQRQRGAAIHTVRGADADHEDVVAIARILERALDALARLRLQQSEPAAAEGCDYSPVAKLQLRSVGRPLDRRYMVIVQTHQVRAELRIHIAVAPPRHSHGLPA